MLHSTMESISVTIAAPNHLIVFCFCNFIIAVLFLLVGNGNGNSNGSSGSTSESYEAESSSAAKTTTDHITVNESVAHESIPAENVEIEDELNEIGNGTEQNEDEDDNDDYELIDINVESEEAVYELSETDENLEIVDEDDDDELRRRVEEFIEKVNRGWKAEKMAN